MFVFDWMTKEVITVTKDNSIEKLTKLMDKYKINHLPVVEDKKLIGIITRSDIRQALMSMKFDKTKSKVHNFMTSEVLTISEYDTLEDVLLLIYDKGIGALPVIDSDNNLIGIITRHDILKAFIKITGLDKNGTTIRLKIKDSSSELEKLTHDLKESKRKILSLFTLDTCDNCKLVSIRFDCIDKIYLENFFTKKGYSFYNPWENY
ncbi:MAG: CBS domain-containing protein [Deferribacterota bacterium]|nr:CBS domain-containing protein [Deferribacterota bacterium]